MLLKFVDPASPTARFIAANLERVERVIERAVERRIRVELTTPAVAPCEPKKAEFDPKIAENPIVSEAISLFDATIHSVRALPTEGGQTPDTGNQPNGDSDDV
jgi:hypothetical protein